MFNVCSWAGFMDIKKPKKIVNNESVDIIWMFDSVFIDTGENPDLDMYVSPPLAS